MFHWKDGWFFSRGENAEVVVEHHTPATFEAPADIRFAIPESEWASIVAVVSPYGDTNKSWDFIRKFHAGELNIEPTVVNPVPPIAGD